MIIQEAHVVLLQNLSVVVPVISPIKSSWFREVAGTEDFASEEFWADASAQIPSIWEIYATNLANNQFANLPISDYLSDYLSCLK